MPGNVLDPEAVAIEGLPEGLAGGLSRLPYVEGRSWHWAVTFREHFPEAAEEFMRLADRVKPETLSLPEFTRRQDAARERLRAKYAAEIAEVDRIEEGRDERLLRAMWGEVA